MKEYKLTIMGHTKETFDGYLRFLEGRYRIKEFHFIEGGFGTIFFSASSEIFLTIEEVLE